MARRFAVVSAYHRQSIQLPRRRTKYSAGYDIEAAEAVTVEAGQTVRIATGLKVYMEPDEVMLIFIRSSWAAKYHLSLANGVGVIDADYADNPDNEGHIMIVVRNDGQNPVRIRPGQAIAQGVFLKYLTTDDDQLSGGRQGGFGSTD